MRLDARLAGQWTPAELGVHPVAGGGPLPAYVRRPHDERLRVILAPPVAGSRLVVVRGEPGAGTTRAAWEAVAGLLAEWPLEYPRTAAALAARLAAGIPAGTVLWLGELGRYADADAGADALDRLDDLFDEDGYLVVATIWPWQWDACIAAVGAGRGAGDPAWLAGRMLARLDELSLYDPSSISPDYGGGLVDVPARFTAGELAEAAGSGDPVLAAAAAAAGPDGQVTHYLAGIPGLLSRYAGPGGDPRGRAVLTAAMDATRLGHAGPLPASLLEQAAAGFLPGTPPAVGREYGPDGAFATGREGATGTGLAWACAGGDGRIAGLTAVPAGEGAGYRLAGALDQHGRQARQDQAGTAALWHALIAHAAGAGTGLLDTTRLGQAARDRGLYRYAAALWTAAAHRGSADAAARLVSLLHETGHEDTGRAADWAAGLVRLNDPWEAARLLDAMRAAQASDAIRALVARDPGGQADLGARWDALRLLVALGAAGAGDAAETLGARLAVLVRLDDVPYLAALLRALGTARAGGAVRALVARDPARHADPDDLRETALLVTAMHAAGPEASDATRALADWAAGHCVIDGAQNVASLLRAMRVAGQADAARRLLDRDPARLGKVDFADSVAWLLTELREAGAGEAIRTLLARDPASHVDLNDPQAIAWLVAELAMAGDVQAIRTLATRVAGPGGFDDLAYLTGWLEHFRAAGDEGLRALLPADRARYAALGPPGDMAWLLEHLVAAGADDLARALLGRDPGGQAGLDDLRDVARLIAALHAAGDVGAARALAARVARDAPQASLADPGGAAALVNGLRAAGEHEAARALLHRDPARQARLGRPQDVARLIAALRAAGAEEAAGILARRAAGAGMFGVFLAYHSDGRDKGGAVSYRYGCEPDLTPAPPWRWTPPGPPAAESSPAR